MGEAAVLFVASFHIQFYPTNLTLKKYSSYYIKIKLAEERKMSVQVTASESKLLFRALAANGTFSTLSGIIMLSFPTSLANLTGIPDKRWLVAIGAGLVIFGGSLLLHAYRKQIRRAEAIAISAMDLFWVLGSVALVYAAPELFTRSGVIGILTVAAIVLGFFELQAYALWKLRKTAI